jgi:type VI secretion system protein ImpM
MTELGLFGKIPAKGDFVRHNVQSPGARAFESWVSESYDALRGANGEQIQHPVRVVFAPPGTGELLIGIMTPSEDQVGRKFPLVVFAHLSGQDLAESFSVLPLVWGPFLESAVRLGQQAATLELEHVRHGLATLVLPGPVEEARCRDMAERALGAPLSDEIHGRLFDGREALYAYNTFLTACETSRNDLSRGGPATVLDCPIRVDVDLFYWLELSRRVFGAAAYPAYFWVEDPAPRLLLSLGPAPMQMLQFLSTPGLEHQRLWPLRTSRDAAIGAAARALGGTVDGLGGATPLSGWIDAMAGRGAAR